MKPFQLFILFGAAYLAIVGAEEDSSSDEEANDVDSESSCKCTKEYKPVCGSDGVTYNNKCLFECENTERNNDGISPITIKCSAPCDKCTVPCICTRELKPVCGSDGVTYGNQCLYDCENKQRAADGKKPNTIKCYAACDKCSVPCVCTREYKPVCGSDGVTYGNECLYNCENKQRKADCRTEITIRCKAPCDKCISSCPCTKEYKPVCGSDGVTYGNQCLYDCENKQREADGRKSITIKCKAPCDKCSSPCSACTKDYKPVCGSDGVTYSNKCDLDCENYKRDQDGEPEISIKCQGDCETCAKVCVCPANYLPVCGSDGRTYSNSCGFDCENKRRKEAGEEEIVIVCKNACDQCTHECICPLNYLPVCGSDGVTYGNECAFNCENERRKKEGKEPIDISCKTECKSCAVPLDE